MLVVKIHKVAVVVAFVLLNIWLLVGSLFAPASGQIQHNQTTADVWVAAFTGVLAFSIINIGGTEAIWKFIAAEAALWNGRYWEAPGIDFVQKPISEKPIKNGQQVSIQGC